MRLPLALTLVAGLLLTVLPAATGAQEPAPSSPASPAPTATLDAFVPVLRFWTSERDVALHEVRAAIEGSGEAYRRVIVASEDPTLLWEALGVAPSSALQAGTVEEVMAAVAHYPF